MKCIAGLFGFYRNKPQLFPKVELEKSCAAEVIDGLHVAKADAYQKEALKTSGGLVIVHKAIYPLLGIIGEVGEIVDKLDGFVFERDGCDLNLEDLKLELGDVLWYSAVCAHYLGLSFSEVMGSEEIDCFQRCQTKGGGLLHRHEVAGRLTKLVSASCHLSERMKKVFRDGNGEFEDKEKKEAVHALRGVVQNLSVLARLLGFTVTDIAASNICKLRSRRERNVIKGDGDNR